MFDLSLKALVVSVGLLLPTVTSAATVSLVYDGGTSNGWTTITSAPTGVPAGTLPWNVGAYGFNMTDTSGQMGDFTAWCLDISHYLGTSGANTYEVTSTPFTNSYGMDASQIARVQAVFDANYATLILGNAIQAAGFQVALWNALYDTDWLATGGLFAVKDGTGGSSSQANAYLLAAMNYHGAHRYNMSFLQSTTNKQNLVTVAPIPLPAAGLLLLTALGGMGTLRRRRRAAAA
jgi:hypothetical protein